MAFYNGSCVGRNDSFSYEGMDGGEGFGEGTIWSRIGTGDCGCGSFEEGAEECVAASWVGCEEGCSWEYFGWWLQCDIGNIG